MIYTALTHEGLSVFTHRLIPPNVKHVLFHGHTLQRFANREIMLVTGEFWSVLEANQHDVDLLALENGDGLGHRAFEMLH